jgi:AraC-like DNA-binding protein
MIDNDQLNDFTMDALMQKAGFSSKSTFLSAFKKIYQCTPSQFIARKKGEK